MSSQWEIVTKSKKHRNIEKPLGQAERKKLVENGPKLEEILPKHQVKTIFSNLNKNKEKKTEKQKTISPKKSKPAAEPVKKQNVPAPPPKPKNLEAALGAIYPEILEDLLGNLKSSFPGSELLWLKGLSAFLNSNLHIETDPIFAGKSLQYPSNVIPKPLKLTIISILTSTGEVNLFYFFDQLLTGLAMDMSKNQPALGNKILLQLIAQTWPNVCSNNFAKSAILLNSYQNRSSIGLSLLWALGQGGLKDLTVGIKVWQNIMLPLSEMKSYSRYVAEYIEKILRSADVHSKITLSQEEFFVTYNALLVHKNFPKDCHQMLNDSASMLIKKYIYSTTKLANIFLRLFRDIEDNSQSQVQIAGCIECLLKSTDCFKIWKMNYKKNALPSLILMGKLSEDWEKLPQGLKEFLQDASLLNNDLLLGKRKDPYAEDLVRITKFSEIFIMAQSTKTNKNKQVKQQTKKNLQDKSSQDKKKSSSDKKSSICPWVCGIFLLIAAIGALISFDVHSHGGIFEKSATGKFLKDTGALPYVEIAWYKTMSTSARGYKWTEENVPIYYAQASVIAKPYVNLLCDLFKIIRNGICQTCETIKEFFFEKSPAVVNFVDSYAPGLPKKIQDFSISAWGSSVNAYQNGCEFFRTKVFVGSLSPENLSKALNQTQTTAAQYYSWFHQKVDAYAKIK